MPVKSDASGRRSVAMDFEVPGTPEQVWDAIATGHGFGAWFVPSTVEERVGGAVRFDLGGGMASSGQVTVWDPPRLFAIEETDWSPGAPPLGTEFHVEALAGGTCRVRLVHTLDANSDKWDDEVGGMENGWPPFFEVLKIYLGEFAGQPAASVRPMRAHPGGLDEAWAALGAALGLAGAKAGDRRASPAGAPALAGEVRRVSTAASNCETLVRLDAPAPGAILIGAFRYGEQTQIGVNLYVYGDGAADVAEREQAVWDAWLEKAFPQQQ